MVNITIPINVSCDSDKAITDRYKDVMYNAVKNASNNQTLNLMHCNYFPNNHSARPVSNICLSTQDHINSDSRCYVFTVLYKI